MPTPDARAGPVTTTPAELASDRVADGPKTPPAAWRSAGAVTNAMAPLASAAFASLIASETAPAKDAPRSPRV